MLMSLIKRNILALKRCLFVSQNDLIFYEIRIKYSKVTMVCNSSYFFCYGFATTMTNYFQLYK